MSLPILDHAKLQEVYLGDRDFLLEVVDVFLIHRDSQVDEIVVAAKTGDPLTIAKAAHKLKGALVTIGAAAAADAARTIEHLGHAAAAGEGDLTDLTAGLTSLHAEMARLSPALDALRA